MFFHSIWPLTCTKYVLTREDIESNPGPRNYAIKKALLASHHQGHSPYGDSAGMQCTSIAYFSIIYSAVKRVGLWKSLDLDIILALEDELFKSVRINKPRVWMNCPLYFHLRAMIFPAKGILMKVICLLI